MDFHKFPVDEQYCEVKFESFGFSNRQVDKLWYASIFIPNPFYPSDPDEVDGGRTQQR